MIGFGDRLVSCLMVTQAPRWQHGIPVGAASYLQQSYHPRELVMVTADPCPAMDRFALEQGCMLHVLPPGAPLGELRQLSLEEANGEFVATWDDDDISGAARIADQLEVLAAMPLADACLLLRVAIRDDINARFYMSPRHAWEMTMVARREAVPTFDPKRRTGEDSDSISRMRQVVVLDRPDLYTHVAHAGAIVAAQMTEEWWADRTTGGPF